MLTAELIRVRSQKRLITASFLDVEAERLLELAGDLIELFDRGREGEWSREQLDAEVKEVAGDRVDHKVIRGLSRVLSDACDFGGEPPVPPRELRERLFTAVSAAPSRRAATEAYQAVAEELGLSTQELQRALYADRKQEQVLVATPSWEPAQLLNRYNVALVQALLLRCEELTLFIAESSPERLRQLFRHLRFRGLMYRISPVEGGHEVHLDGPTSLLRLSTRYGMALANWFPALLLQPSEWRLTATIRWTKRRLRKELNLSSELGLRSHIADTGAYQSRTSQWFEERWSASDSGWELTRDAGLIDLSGEGVVVPDFSFRRDGREAHLEIIGVWRKAWLKARMKQLQQHGPGNLVMAVSSKLAGSKESLVKFPGEVVYFKEVVPIKDVLEAIERCAR